MNENIMNRYTKHNENEIRIGNQLARSLQHTPEMIGRRRHMDTQ